MINFPTLFPQRSIRDNNRPKKKSAVKASKESAEIAAEKHVATTEQRRDPAHRGHLYKPGQQSSLRERQERLKESRSKAKHIDIEV